MWSGILGSRILGIQVYLVQIILIYSNHLSNIHI